MGRPKALLPFGGRTFLENIIQVIDSSSVEQTVVVLGHHRSEILEAIRLENAIFNSDYEQGMITSIQAGIRSLHADAEGALLFLVDHPLTSVATIESLVENFKPGRIVLPTFEGRRGHPVLFSKAVLEEILAVPVTEGANGIVWTDPSRIIEVPVEDPGIRIDVDTPEDFHRL